MTIEQAKDEIGENFETFANYMCVNCTANDWYCPSYCDLLKRLSNMDFDYILEKYAYYDGDIIKFSKYFKNKGRIKNDKQRKNIKSNRTCNG